MYSVYRHTCPNGKVYIGLTKGRPEKRWGVDGRGYKTQQHFYRAIQKYGWDNIKHEVLYTGLTQEEACITERQLIRHYNSTNPEHGYNNSGGGEIGAWKYKSKDEIYKETISKQLKAAVKEAHEVLQEIAIEKFKKNPCGKHACEIIEHTINHRKPVIRLESSEVFKSVSSAAEFIGVETKHISYSLNHNISCHGHWDFLPENYTEEWRVNRLKELTYVRPKKEPFINPNGYHKWSDEAKQASKGKNGKPVIQMTLDGIEIAEFPSSVIAGETLGINHRKIRMVCNGEQNQCGNFRWKWKNGSTPEKEITCIGKKFESKQVYCLETDTTYQSIGEASRQLNCDRKLVSKVCNKEQQSTHGYHFYFVESA